MNRVVLSVLTSIGVILVLKGAGVTEMSAGFAIGVGLLGCVLGHAVGALVDIADRAKR